MNARNQYREDVKAFLRDGYGARNFKYETGGTHTRLIFELSGEHRSLLLNDHNASGPKASVIKMQDIRREYGEPTYPLLRNSVKRRVSPPSGMTSSVEALSPSPSVEAPSSSIDVARPSPQDEMREALKLIARIELETPYRLRRVKANEEYRWIWRAPEVSLSDDPP
jgi:hypothetical protein